MTTETKPLLSDAKLFKMSSKRTDAVWFDHKHSFDEDHLLTEIEAGMKDVRDIYEKARTQDAQTIAERDRTIMRLREAGNNLKYALCAMPGSGAEAKVIEAWTAALSPLTPTGAEPTPTDR